MTLQGFFDDSGAGAPVFVLSGYASNVHWWEEFAGRWQALLDEEPKLPYFKMREAARGFGGKMRQPDANERIARFLDLIRLVVHGSVSCVVPFRLYERIAKGKVDERFDDPYFLAIFDLMTKIIENQMAVSSPDVFEFIFDDNPRLAACVPYWYQFTRQFFLTEQARSLIGTSPKFENDHEFLPLQAVDAQAWYFRRLFAEKMTGEPFPTGVPKELFQVLDNIPTLLSLWDASRLGNLANKRPQPEGVTCPPFLVQS